MSSRRVEYGVSSIRIFLYIGVWFGDFVNVFGWYFFWTGWRCFEVSLVGTFL